MKPCLSFYLRIAAMLNCVPQQMAIVKNVMYMNLWSRDHNRGRSWKCVCVCTTKCFPRLVGASWSSDHYLVASKQFNFYRHNKSNVSREIIYTRDVLNKSITGFPISGSLSFCDVAFVIRPKHDFSMLLAFWFDCRRFVDPFFSLFFFLLQLMTMKLMRQLGFHSFSRLFLSLMYHGLLECSGRWGERKTNEHK